MKRILFFLLVVIIAPLVNAQSVGIGTTTPSASAQLDVTSTTKGMLIPRMTGAERMAIPTPAIGLLVIQTNTEVVPPASSPGLYLYEQDGLSSVWRRIARTDEIPVVSPTWTVNGSDQFSNVAGNVGIGTSTPNAKAALDISSTTKGLLIPSMTTTQRFAITTPPNGLMVYDTDKNEFYQYGGTSWKTILNSDYWSRPITSRDRIANATDSVGIGLSNAVERLDVNGNIRSRNNLLVDNNITAAGDVIVTGNVGIGINTPATKFHLVGDGTLESGDLAINNSTGGIKWKDANITKARAQMFGGNFDLNIGTVAGNTTGKLFLETQGLNRLTIDPAGNVGIGTITPDEKLHVSGNISVTGNLLSTGEMTMNNATGTLQLQNAGVNKGFVQLSGNNLRMGTNSGNTTGNMVIRMNGNDRITINPSGDIDLEGKITRTAVTSNASLTPICYGRVSFSAASFSGTSNVSVERISQGIYELTCPQFNSTTTIIVTMNEYVGGVYAYPNVEYWTPSGPNVYRVPFFNSTAGGFRDAGFSFIAYNLN